MITLICGLPRAGKTTLAKQYHNVIHLDDFGRMPMQQRYKHCNAKAEVSCDITVEGIYEKAEYRIGLLKSYRGQGATCIWLDTPSEIKQTRHGYSKKCEFPFDPPTYAEGWDEIIRITGE